MNLLQTALNYIPNLLPQFKVQHNEIPVGGGYYAQRLNQSAGGTNYNKLVKADRSNSYSPIFKSRGIPSVGKRTDKPAKHRARSKKD